MATKRDHPSEDSDPDEAMDDINIDFEMFDPMPLDFHGLKTLLKQLFDVDANDVWNSALSDLIIAAPLLGTTVKVSDEVTENAKENDPFAFTSVLNLQTHRENAVVREVVEYLLSVSSKIPSLASLPGLVKGEEGAQVGLLLNERFINIPPTLVPPQYNMLLEEIQWAVDAKEPYAFTHYLILSKTYTEITSKLNAIIDEAASAPDRKKQKGAKKAKDVGDGTTGETFYFHPEDEVWQRFAIGYGSFEYKKEREEGASDAKRAFQEAGIKSLGHLILIDAKRFKDAVQAVGEYISQSS